MIELLPDLLLEAARRTPDAVALRHSGQDYAYAELADWMEKSAHGLRSLGLERRGRVAVYLPKRMETVMALFGASHAGGVFVPVNPLLKPAQVAYILRDCNVRILVTSNQRATDLAPRLAACPDVKAIVCVDDGTPAPVTHLNDVAVLSWTALLAGAASTPQPRIISADMAAILYTSGSTGNPKGVVLSHQNMVLGAKSVAHYLENSAADRILAVLPLSFDYGFSQLSTAFLRGACAVLMDYFLPRDVINAVRRERITGLAGVPPLWVQLAQLPWPEEAAASLRYITNSGGAMPMATLKKLRGHLPRTQVYLMYGLTEAFRSTYLPPTEVEQRPDSIGKAIPHAEILVVAEDGRLCAPDEPGELVHRGALVAMGYWNDAEKTAQRFRPLRLETGLVQGEIAVWSGDTVRCDADGYLYFVARRDEMIKTSGYRVSPTELEEVIYASGMVGEACAVGVPHVELGQAIVVIATPNPTGQFMDGQLLIECKKNLPNFMIPSRIVWRDSLPRNPNGKIDRRQLAEEFKTLFNGDAT